MHNPYIYNSVVELKLLICLFESTRQSTSLSMGWEQGQEDGELKFVLKLNRLLLHVIVETRRYNYFYEHSVYANSKQFLRPNKSLRIIIRVAGLASDVCVFTISFNLF